MCEIKLNWKIPFKDILDTENRTERVLGMKEMAIPIFAGILSALRRVIARRVSLKVLTSIYMQHTTTSFSFSLCKSYWLTTTTSDCSHSLLSEPTQKAASCNNNCFCYMFSISCGHVGHDYSEFLVGRHDFFL